MSKVSDGEVKHETCVHGRLTEAWVGGDALSVPLCTWSIPEPAPPVVVRLWGGRVIPGRDCRRCPAWQRVPRFVGEPR